MTHIGLNTTRVPHKCTFIFFKGVYVYNVYEYTVHPPYRKGGYACKYYTV